MEQSHVADGYRITNTLFDAKGVRMLCRLMLALDVKIMSFVPVVRFNLDYGAFGAKLRCEGPSWLQR